MRNYLFKSLIFMFMAFAILSCGKSDDAKGDGAVISADKILKQIRQGKNVNVYNKTITGKLDFTELSLSGKKLDVSAVYIPVEVCFRNCVFEDSVLTFSSNDELKKDLLTVFERNVIFQECEFRQALVMPQTCFRGRFDFDICKVEGESDFSGCSFRDGVSFRQSNFGGDSYFVSCNFFGRSNFMKVLFKNSAVFQYVRFHDAAMFADSHFYGGVDMSRLYAGAYIDFSNAKFSGNVLMAYSQYLCDLRLVSCSFSKRLSFCNNMVCGTIKMPKAKFGSELVFSDNILMSAPETQDVEKSDSCAVSQTNNKLVDMIVKPIL